MRTGDLTTAIDPVLATSRYTYSADHYLEDILDPRGVRAVRNLYNEEGRLVGQIDADGNEIEYAHDIAGRTETVTDRRGNARTLVFNDRGDVIADTNALGDTTLSVRVFGGEGACPVAVPARKT